MPHTLALPCHPHLVYHQSPLPRRRRPSGGVQPLGAPHAYFSVGGRGPARPCHAVRPYDAWVGPTGVGRDGGVGGVSAWRQLGPAGEGGAERRAVLESCVGGEGYHGGVRVEGVPL